MFVPKMLVPATEQSAIVYENLRKIDCDYYTRRLMEKYIYISSKKEKKKEIWTLKFLCDVGRNL
jgi:hypothetical protein